MQQPNFTFREYALPNSNGNLTGFPLGTKIHFNTPAADRNKVYFYYYASVATRALYFMRGTIRYSLGPQVQLEQPWMYGFSDGTTAYTAVGANSLPTPNVIAAAGNPVGDCIGIAIGAGAFLSNGTGGLLRNQGGPLVDFNYPAQALSQVEPLSALIYPFYADFPFDQVQVSITDTLGIYGCRLFLAVTSLRQPQLPIRTGLL